MLTPPLLSRLALCLLGCVAVVFPLPPTEPPLIDSHPFVAIWHAPINQCSKLEIPLDTSAFQVVNTPAAVPGQFLTIFYEDRLGLYPKADHVKRFSGGIPQKGNLTGHLAKAQRDIDHYISQDSSAGLAVIDWEAWRPLWDQNSGSKRIYRKLSLAHAQDTSPFLKSKQITSKAKKQFQCAGRRYMEKTIALGVDERPSRRWGFYLFPNCYNYGWDKPGYTGKCSKKTQRQNDQLLWLWESSTALFPSVYLNLSMRNSSATALYVQNRVQEAQRVAALPKRPYTMPVYVYSRPLYHNQNQKFLSQEDLVSSIGETAALGASCIVMWGASSDYNNQAACESLSEYLVSSLNPYLANVTAAARLCSKVLCQGNGRCVRKSYGSADYLHLNPDRFHVLQADRKYLAVGFPSAADLRALAEKFTCQCYAGRTCSAKLSRPRKLVLLWV
ncbi:hyaluronidase PH-20-like [Centroberyx affinis]|uniref:hyaluronidase PH-20-like n=1 Tax=Centroberyx affinis TaxID=166261 RepID=UPI003A5C38CE